MIPIRRVASGGAGGAMPPNFCSCPPPSDFFLAPPHGIFLGGKSCCFWAKKTLKFAISARKKPWISAKTFFFYFFGDHLLLVGKLVISARKNLRISAKIFAPLILILPPNLAKLATPLIPIFIVRTPFIV